MNNVGVTEEQVIVHQQLLSLQLSWNCNAACRHCMVSGKSNRSRVMTSSEAKHILDELEKMPLTHFVGFTGGEAFLYYELLLDLATYLQQKYGYPFGIATNCFWASDRARARDILSPLVDRGLQELLISLDDFHLEFVEGKCIENCIHEAIDLGVDVMVQTVKTRTSHDQRYFQEHMDIPLPPKVQWVETRCHPAGRAVSQIPKSEYVRDWKIQAGHCTAMRVWNVDPRGEVTPCCGTAFARPLRVGNAFEQDLSVLVNQANVNPLLNTIAAWGGPYMLIKILEQNGDFRYSERLFSSNCDACATILRDVQAVKVLKSELSDHGLDALASRLAAHTLWYQTVALNHKDSNWLPDGWLSDE